MYAFLVEKAQDRFGTSRRGGDVEVMMERVAGVRRPVERDPRLDLERRLARELHVVHPARRARRRGTAAASSSSARPRTAARPRSPRARRRPSRTRSCSPSCCSTRDAVDQALWDEFHARRLPRATEVVEASVQLGQWQIDGVRDADVAGLMLRHRDARWRSPHERRPTHARAVTDVHAHLLLPALHAEVERARPRGRSPRRRRSRLAATAPRAWPCRAAWSASACRCSPSLDARLAEMDAQGVDVQCGERRRRTHYYPWAPRGARRLGRARGEPRSSPSTSRSAPDRLLGLGLVPLQHPQLDRRVPRRRRARARPRRRRDLVVRRRRRALGRAARAVLGARRGARRDRVPAPVRLQPRRAARPLLPLEHRRPAGRERRRAVAPHLLGRARPASRTARSSPRTAAGTCRRSIGRSDHAWQVRPEAHGCRELPSSYLRRLRFDSLVHTPGALRAPRRRGGRRPGAARHGLSRSTWASTTRSSACARPGSPRPTSARSSSGNAAELFDGAAHAAGGRVRIARWRHDGARRRGLRRRRRRRAVPARPDGRRRARRRARRGARARRARPTPRHPCRSPRSSCSRRSCPRACATSWRSRSTSRASPPRSTARATWSTSGTSSRRSTSRTRTRSSRPAPRCARRRPSASTSSSRWAR